MYKLKIISTEETSQIGLGELKCIAMLFVSKSSIKWKKIVRDEISGKAVVVSLRIFEARNSRIARKSVNGAKMPLKTGVTTYILPLFLEP